MMRGTVWSSPLLPATDSGRSAKCRPSRLRSPPVQSKSISRPWGILVALMGLLTAAIAVLCLADEPPKGFAKLFNGKDL